MSEEALKQYGVKPLVRIASYAWSACEPEIMGIGPVVSVRQALAKIGKSVGDMDLIEVNEVSAVPTAEWTAESSQEAADCSGIRRAVAGSAERARAAG